MATDSDLDLIISANSDGVQTGLSQAKTQVQSAVSNIEKSFQSLNTNTQNHTAQLNDAFKNFANQSKQNFNAVSETIEMFSAKFIALSAVLAGGALFKGGVTSVLEEAGVVKKLSSELGITTENASKLNMTLSVLGISTDTYEGALTGVTKALKTNEEVFTKNGVAIRDSKGQLLDSQQIMQNTIQYLTGIKDGTERNVAAMAMMGRGWKELTSLQLLNNEAMEKGSTLAEKLGQVLTEEDIAKAIEYKKAMNTVAEIMDALRQEIGEALIPVLTSIGQWFGEIGPDAVSAFGTVVSGVGTILSGIVDIVATLLNMVKSVFGAIVSIVSGAFEAMGGKSLTFKELMTNSFNVVLITFISFKTGVLAALEAIKLVIEEVIAYFRMLGQIGYDIFVKFDFKGALNHYNEAAAGMRKIASDHIGKMKELGTKGRAEIDELLFGGKEGAASSGKGKDKNGTFTPVDKTKKDGPSLLEKWKNELEQRKIQENDFFKDSLEDDIAFWEQKIAIIERMGKKGSKEWLSIEHELYNLRSQLAKRNLAEQLQLLESEIAADKNNAGKRVVIVKQELEIIKKTYGERSKEYQTMLRKLLDAEKDFQAQQNAMRAEGIRTQKTLDIGNVDAQIEAIKFKRQLGEINAVQELRMLRELEEQRYQIELQAAKDEADLITGNVEERQRALDRIIIMEQEHANKMKKIGNDIVLENIKQWKDVLEPISGAINTSIQGIIQGTTSLKKALGNLLQSIVLSFAKMGTDILMNWVAKQLGMTAASAAGAKARNAIEAQSAFVAVSTQAGVAIKSIFNYAAQTFAAIYQALAGIPFIGPYIAPAAAAAGMATVAGMAGSVMSASKGFDIPAGVNPMTQLHEKEMVLPAKEANTIRNLGDGGGQPIQINISAIDGHSVERFFKKHGGVIADSLKIQARNFKVSK